MATLRTTAVTLEVLQTQVESDVRTTSFTLEVLQTKAESKARPIRTTALTLEVLQTKEYRYGTTFDASLSTRIVFRNRFFSDITITTGGTSFTDLFEATFSGSIGITTSGTENDVFHVLDQTVGWQELISPSEFSATATLDEMGRLTTSGTENDTFSAFVDYQASFSDTVPSNTSKTTATINDTVEYGSPAAVAYSTGIGVSKQETCRADIVGQSLSFGSTVTFGTLTLRNPIFGDTHGVMGFTDVRQFRDGTPEIVDRSFPEYEEFYAVFENLTKDEADAVETFVKANLGQPVSYTHYDGRTLNVIFIEPAIANRDKGRNCQYKVELKYVQA